MPYLVDEASSTMAENPSSHSHPRDVARDENPRKRRRIDKAYGNNEHDRSHSSTRQVKGAPNTRNGRRPLRGASYRPNYDNARSRHNNFQSTHGRHNLPLSQPKILTLEELQSQQTEQGTRDKSSTSQDPVDRRKHSKKQRKENPSTRIHSLRKQLARASNLPPTIARERERELAALVFEQEKNKLKVSSKKNLERYHFVRFIERKRAIRNLKKAKQYKQAGDIVWKDAEESENGEPIWREMPIDDKIHEYEIDLLYTQYSPLGEKYISIYAETNVKTGEEVSKAEKYKGNWNLVKNKADLAALSEQQKTALQTASEEAANLVTLNFATSRFTEENKKPPIWFEIEAAMGNQGKLEAIRERLPVGPEDQKQFVVGVDHKSKMETKAKSTPDWLDDDGAINPDDLDSDSDEDMYNGNAGGVKLDKADSDDEMSDGAGGFFEGVN